MANVPQGLTDSDVSDTQPAVSYPLVFDTAKASTRGMKISRGNKIWERERLDK